MAEAAQAGGRSLIGRFLSGVLQLAEGRVSGARFADEVLAEMRGHLDRAVDPASAELTARANATAVGQLYLSSKLAVRRALMQMLVTDYGIDREAVAAAARTFVDAEKGDMPALREAVVPRRTAFLSRLTSVEGGIKFLVDLRADVLDATESDRTLIPLADDIKDLLSLWFDLGLLEMRRITWNSPASLLEKLIAYEAVHEVRSWDDLKGRLGPDRRLYALFHPNIPDEPLIFIQVAFTKGMADSVDALIEHRAEHESGFDTAVFYSISNTQPGLAGIPFGEYLIKEVVEDIRASERGVDHFATLSPIPGLRRWLERTGVDIESADKSQLMAMTARYLTTFDGERGRALDPVGHFHLSNGARVERLNWQADTSDRGQRQSFGMMINYAYDLKRLDQRKTAYALDGEISMTRQLRELARSVA